MQAILTECSCFVVEKKRTTFAITAVELYREKILLWLLQYKFNYSSTANNTGLGSNQIKSANGKINTCKKEIK